MFLHLHHHPTAKKILIRENLGASKRVKFWLSRQCFYICTITLRRKKSKFGKILGHQKGSNFCSVDNVFTSVPSPYGKKNPNSAKSWGIKKGQIFPHLYTFEASEYLERRCRAHSGGLRPPPCQPAFGRLAGAARSEKCTAFKSSLYSQMFVKEATKYTCSYFLWLYFGFGTAIGSALSLAALSTLKLLLET